jgi:hypothetical protein
LLIDTRGCNFSLTTVIAAIVALKIGELSFFLSASFDTLSSSCKAAITAFDL